MTDKPSDDAPVKIEKLPKVSPTNSFGKVPETVDNGFDLGIGDLTEQENRTGLDL